MNINQVSKLFNDMNNQEVRTIELKVGQVVRGVVTQQLPNQEALVNINGVQVKAKLEVPILEGQATLMQVAPNSKGSFIHLKQVDPASLGLQDPMKDILKAMQLPDKDWSNQLVRELRQEGFPLNRETLQALAQAAKLAPSNVDLEGWMQAATLAFKRGMPMTLSSISAMHQLSQGTPLHQLMGQVQQQLSQLLQSGQSFSGQTSQLLQQLSQSLGQLVQLQSTQQLSQTQQQTITTPVQNQPVVTQTGQQAAPASNQQASAQGSNQQGVPQLSASGMSVQNPIASFMKLLGVQHENTLGQQLIAKGDFATATATTQQTQAAVGHNQNQTMQQGPQQGQPVVHQSQQASVPLTGQQGSPTIASSSVGQLQQANQQAITQTQSNTVQQFQQQVSQPVPQGTSQTSQVAQPGGTITSQQPVISQEPTAQPLPVQTSSASLSQPNQVNSALSQSSSQQVPNQVQAQTAELIHEDGVIRQSNVQSSGTILNQASESVKSTVLQLLQLTDVPATVKESMTQLLNHITGQQMMLATERNHSMFTHITMYIPLQNEQGGQTAAIHVQTRRDRKGQLDAENCRIVFDLNMNQLGQTMVDLNVVNKIVSINIWNDKSYIQPLVDTMRPEIFESLQKTGYSLSSIKATPFKQEPQLDEVKAIVHPPDIQHLNATRYKGVDLKV